jgi:inosose dehydratase
MDRIVSCFTNCYGPAGVRAAVEHIRSAGLEYLEVALRGHNFAGLVIPESAVITEKADDATAQEFLDFMAAHGVKASSCNGFGANLLTTDGVELYERRLKFAARWFKVPVVIGVGGPPPSNDAERKTMISHLRRIGDTAAPLGITVALETHKGATQNAAAMLETMSEVNHPNIRINFDTGNIAYYNKGANPADELEKVKHLVASIHLKDNRGGFEDWYFPPLGEGGAVDIPRIRRIMDEIGFRGPYTIEIEGFHNEPEPGVEERHERIRKSVQYLRTCGFFDPMP